jgi:hypothetical protein
MTLQALSGVIALRLVSREGSPSLLEVRHTHTHTAATKLGSLSDHVLSQYSLAHL